MKGDSMKLFKKLAITVSSGVDAMADRFENKEALSIAYIREYERVVAKAKVRSAQVDEEVARLEKEAVRLKEQAALWAERARQVHLSDESKALACVARMTQAQKDHRQVASELDEVMNLKRKMAGDVDHILKKLEAVKRKHQNLAGRQACAEAAYALQRTDGGIHHDIDDLFTRWETDVVARELHARCETVVNDTLTAEFDADEQQQALRVVLDQLIADPKPEGEV